MTATPIAMPVFAPLFVPGTERVKVRWATVEIPVSAEITARCLPAGLGVPAHPTAGLWLAEFIGAEFRSSAGTERRPDYLQGGVSLRCTGYGGGADGAYAIETFVEGLNHGILGRELFGLPKKQARRVTLDEADGHLEFGITSALGETLVSGHAALHGEDRAAGATPAPAWFDRHFTVKAIPSAEGHGYDVCKLVEIPWAMRATEPVREGIAEMAWGASDVDPLHRFAPTGPAHLRYGVATLDIGFGRYLTDLTPPEPLGSSSWHPRTASTPPTSP